MKMRNNASFIIVKIINNYAKLMKNVATRSLNLT